MTERISPKALRQYPWWLQLLFKIQKKKFGQVLMPSLLWGYSPWQCFTMTVFFLAVDRKHSPLDPVLKSLIMTRVAQLIECRYCIDINGAMLLERSQSREKVINLQHWKTSSQYTEVEKLSLEYAETMTLNSTPVSDALFSKLREHFSNEALVELTGVIAYQNLSARFNAALNIAPQGFCELPLNQS